MLEAASEVIEVVGLYRFRSLKGPLMRIPLSNRRFPLPCLFRGTDGATGGFKSKVPPFHEEVHAGSTGTSAGKGAKASRAALCSISELEAPQLVDLGFLWASSIYAASSLHCFVWHHDLDSCQESSALCHAFRQTRSES
eukprot:4946244-Amphidinium_carterae.1